MRANNSGGPEYSKTLRDGKYAASSEIPRSMNARKGLTRGGLWAPLVLNQMALGPHIDPRPSAPLRPGVLALLFLLTTTLSLQGTPWRWDWSNPLPHGNDIADIGFHPTHQFIQVTAHGQLYASSTLDQWVSRETGTRKNLRAVAFMRDRMVISGERGLILWSDDGHRFNRVDLATENWLEGVAASTNRVIAVGDNAAIYSSDDAITWVPQPVPFTNWLHGVARSEEVFAAVGDDGLIITSPDGVEWTQRSIADGNTARLNRIAWTGNGFVVAGDAFEGASTVIFGNSSGSSWVRQTQSGATGDLLTAAAASPSSRLVAGDQEVRLASGAAVIFWSDEMAPPFGAPPELYLAAASDGFDYVLGGLTGLTVRTVPMRSIVEGNEWSEFPSPPRNWLFDVVGTTLLSTNVSVTLEGETPVYESTTVTNRLYVAAGDLGTLLTSEGGVTWTQSIQPSSVSNQVYLALTSNALGIVAAGSGGVVSFSPNQFVTVVSTNQLEFVESTNTTVIEVTRTNAVNSLGILWLNGESSTPLDLLAACASPDLFVVGGQGGFMAISPDGTNWISQVTGTDRVISGLEFWSGGYVAVGEDGTILTSLDAVYWTPRESGTTNWLFRVRAAQGQLVAVGREGTVLTSPDGITWTPRSSGVSHALNDVEFTVAGWFIAGSQGTVLHSADGVNWIQDDQLITGKSMYGLATQDIQLIAVGIEGAILRTRLAPYLNPVEIVKYPHSPLENEFIFRGELDQRFRLDQGPSVNALKLGPILSIPNPDGLMIYRDPEARGSDARIYYVPGTP